MIRNAFNIAACLVGASVATAEAVLIDWATSAPATGGWINLQPSLTGLELATHSALGLAGLGLFLLGYNRVIGNGKTLNALRTAVNKIDTTPKP